MTFIQQVGAERPEIASVSDRPIPQVHPREIQLRDTGATSIGTFNKNEVEISAGHLISFFQARGKWCGFTISDLVRFYDERGWDRNVMFFGLMGTWYDDGALGSWKNQYGETWIVQDPRGNMFVTGEFIERCLYGKTGGTH
jgi:hypothetical protein